MSVALSPQGTTVAYRTAGSGPPELLFLHGWAGSAAYFEETFASLDLDHVRATAIDLSGHGDSPPDGAEWSLEGIDASALAAADAVGAERFVVVGYSMGGKFAQHLALAHPERVAGLVLVAGSPAAAIPLPPEMLEDWYARAGDAEALKELVRGFLTGPVDEAAFDRWARDAARIPRAALEGSLTATVETDFASSLASLRVPTLVVAGARDEMFTPEMLRQTMVARIEGARMAMVDCGHEIPLERPRELAALIEAFLSGLSG